MIMTDDQLTSLAREYAEYSATEDYPDIEGYVKEQVMEKITKEVER